MRRQTKYFNRPVILDGIKFQSIKEADYYCELKLMVWSGAVVDFKRQVPYELIPAQYIGKKCVEQGVKYYADFVVSYPDGRQEVVDIKGMRTYPYILKRKMMLFFHGIRIKEI